MAIVEVSIVPIGTGSTSLSKYVANCYKVLQNQSKVKYKLTAMGTILEGDLQEILMLVSDMHEIPYKEGAKRVITSIKIDDRRDIRASIQQKISSVEEKI